MTAIKDSSLWNCLQFGNAVLCLEDQLQGHGNENRLSDQQSQGKQKNNTKLPSYLSAMFLKTQSQSCGEPKGWDIKIPVLQEASGSRASWNEVQEFQSRSSQPVGHDSFGVGATLSRGHLRPLENTNAYIMVHKSSEITVKKQQ